MDWKKISKRLSKIHEEKKSSVVRLTPFTEGVVVNLSNDSFCLEVPGEQLSAKKVRKFLWENRKKRALQRKNAILWSAYLEDDDTSYVGVGALTLKQAI
mgnify:CR=1 FL=1